MGEVATREGGGEPGERARSTETTRRPGGVAGSSLPPLPASRLLVGGRRLLLLPRLVDLIGLNEAIVLQQVRYYLEDERQPRVAEGRRWVRAPLGRWQERDFPFWTTRTIERTFASLAGRGLVVAQQLDLRTGDATNSYTIDWAELDALDRGAPPSPERGGGSLPAAGGDLPPLPASNYLDEEDLLPIGVRLAALVGLDEAVVLRQIYYWLGDRRRPPVRDGLRWVCPAQTPFWESLAFRSRKTIQRALQDLERRGLLLSSTGYNASPRDRTKWYTIDFGALERLEMGPAGCDTATGNANNPECRDGSTQNVGMDAPNLSASKRPVRRDPSTRDVGMEGTNLAASLMDGETDRETQGETQQQQAVSGDSPAASNVVIASIAESDVCEDLAGHGVTRAVARRLLATFGAARVSRHCEVHAWERATYPERPELTPGRLRRRIEEDWAAPPGFRTAAERAEEEAALAAAAGDAAERVRREAAAVAVREQAYQARLAAVGLTPEDQRLWSRFAHEAPVLAPLFRQALFYGTDGTTPAALLFANPGDVERATGAAYGSTRDMIASRLARHYRRPVEIRYLWYDEVARLLSEGAGDAADSSSGAGSAR